MDKIIPQPKINSPEQSLKWLSEKENHSLRSDGCTELIRLLIIKVNLLSTEVDFLKNKVDQLDSFNK